MSHWIVSREQAGRKLVSVLSDWLPDAFSQKKIKLALERNCCTVNGAKEHFASREVVAGDRITFDVEAAEHLIKAKPSRTDPSRILFQDNDLFIYNKPSGISSEDLLVQLQKQDPALKLGHRLDRDTTGVLIFVRNEVVRQKLIQQFREFQVKKCYVAIVDGVLKEKSGMVDNYLAKKGERGGRPFWGSVAKEKGSHALTEWEVVEKGKEETVVRCRPLTGRTHQIRVHLSEMGHPILGDDLYGERYCSKRTATRCLLHAEEIELLHPMTQQLLHVVAPLPDDMKLC